MARNHPYVLDSRPLGRGGMGEVLKATHRVTGETVALKRSLDSDPVSRSRLKREISVQATLDHPHIVPILDAAEDHTWFTMPLASGILSLDTYPRYDHDRRGSRVTGFDPWLLAWPIRDAILGLQAAHDAGYVHRDIKPSNLLSMRHSGWAVADWGLVRRPLGDTSNPLTVKGRVVGTELFAAPEILEDAHQVAPSADVYSLGKTVAWALTGKYCRPFKAPEVDGIWAGFVEETTRSESGARPQAMSDLLHLIDRMFPQRSWARGFSIINPQPGLDDCYKCGAYVGRRARCPNCGQPTNDY